MHFGPEEAVGVVIHLDRPLQQLGQIGTQMATIDGGQIGRHYAVIVAVDDTGKTDTDRAPSPEAGIRQLDPGADQLLQPLIIVARGAHALLVA